LSGLKTKNTFLFLLYILVLLFLGKINILKTTSTLRVWLKVSPSGGHCKVLTPSLHVINSRTQKSGFSQTCLIFMIFQNKLWWRLHNLFFKLVSFLFRRPVAILIAISLFWTFSSLFFKALICSSKRTIWISLSNCSFHISTVLYSILDPFTPPPSPPSPPHTHLYRPTHTQIDRYI